MSLKADEEWAKVGSLISLHRHVQKNRLWDFAGLATQKGMNDQSQRDHFARQLATHLKLASFIFQDWTDAFEQIACEHSQKIFYRLCGKPLSLFVPLG